MNGLNVNSLRSTFCAEVSAELVHETFRRSVDGGERSWEGAKNLIIIKKSKEFKFLGRPKLTCKNIGPLYTYRANVDNYTPFALNHLKKYKMSHSSHRDNIAGHLKSKLI